MHYNLQILVRASNKKDAESEATATLESYQRDVWDWYALGGRWDLGDKNIINATSPEFWERIEKCGEYQREEIVRSVNNAKEILNKDNLTFDSFFDIITNEFKLAVSNKVHNEIIEGLFFFYLRNIASLLDGTTTSNSYIIISNNIWGGSKLPLHKAIVDEIKENKEEYYLLNYDLHN